MIIKLANFQTKGSTPGLKVHDVYVWTDQLSNSYSKQIAYHKSNHLLLLTVAAISSLAQLALQIVVGTERNVGVGRC